MIKNAVFDMGNVLIRWDPDRIIDDAASFLPAGRPLTAADKALMRRNIFSDWEWCALDRGTLTPEEGFERMKKKLPDDLHPAAYYCIVQWWTKSLFPVEGMEAVVRELHETGKKIYLLSNATSALHAYFDRIPGSQYFSGKVVSADEKITKPQPEIYRKLLERFDLDPGECCFIDDNPANIEAAIDCCGLHGIVFFDDIPALRRQLEAIGALPPALR